MSRESDTASRKGDGYLRCLQMSIFTYGILNIIIRGAELLLAIIGTSVIVAAYVTGINHPNSFQEYLNVEAKHAVWRGPLTTLIANIHANTNMSMMATSLQEMNSDVTEDKVNLHIWSDYFLIKCITFVYGFLLVASAKKFSFSGNLAWLSYSVPILAQYILQLVLDLSLGDYLERDLPSQIWQGLDLSFQLLGIVVVSCFLYRLYHWDERIQEIDRYNGLPSSRLNGDISITEIIEDDQRFK